MARGGRTSTTWNPSWNLGKTRTIRVPIAIADKVLAYARELDANRCQHDYIPYWQALDALVIRCKNCGVERSPTTDELAAVLGTVLSVRDDYQHQALTAGKRSRREELEQAVAEKNRQVEYLKGRLEK